MRRAVTIGGRIYHFEKAGTPPTIVAYVVSAEPGWLVDVTWQHRELEVAVIPGMPSVEVEAVLTRSDFDTSWLPKPQ